MCGPSDEARFSEFLEFSIAFRRGTSLLRIGSDDFEVAASAERKKSVLRAAARVNSAKCRAYAGVPFDKIDTALKIAAAEKDVVEHRRYLID